MSDLKSFLTGRKPVTFIDLFAGAGGISEGFLQADAKDKGRFRKEIIRKMRSIIDENEIDDFLHYLKGMIYKVTSKFMADAFYYKYNYIRISA